MSLEGQEDYSANSIIKAIMKKTTKHTLFSLFEERIDYFANTT